ncbi:GNAT family N-acetyltransferase [Kitasatospora sp. NPDC057223]|uniref:GNAT family N-acetyltransferase n=1 Tax=Kitasatospora sp. NPDC057223 TaxID=3346055 RepID=UPI003644431A
MIPAPPCAELRQASPDDDAELTRLRLVMLAAAGLSAPDDAWIGRCLTYFAEHLADDPAFNAFVVASGRRLLACAVGQYIPRLPRPGAGPHIGHITSVATDPDHRRQGHARRAVEAVHRWLADAGCSSILLTATLDAEPLYRSLGYGTDATPLVWSAP